ncbi:MAG TPA: Hsp20/alpha crystallin family protein [Mycobacterium sp.]|jgi:HSP20 family protein|nr:Hsp20/alpha crystallin family protein [Mycobacterium sp.]
MRDELVIKPEHRMPWPLEPAWTGERIDRMFRGMVREMFTGVSPMDRFFEWPSTVLRLEEYVEGDAGVIRAELPGIDPDKDVEITVSDGVLHIVAHREERTEEKLPEVYRSEFRYGRFERHIRLPEGTTEADAKASYKDGILEVRVPVAATTAPAATKVLVEHG